MTTVSAAFERLLGAAALYKTELAMNPTVAPDEALARAVMASYAPLVDLTALPAADVQDVLAEHSLHPEATLAGVRAGTLAAADVWGAELGALIGAIVHLAQVMAFDHNHPDWVAGLSLLLDGMQMGADE